MTEKTKRDQPVTYPEVRAQPGRDPGRWAYVIHYADGDSYVSHARFRSPETAVAAGRADVAAEAAFVAAGCPSQKG